MNQPATPQVQDVWSGPRVSREFRALLPELKKDRTSFLELPQPKRRNRVTKLQNTVQVDMPGLSASERSLDGRTLNLYILARPPPGARANPLALWRQRDSPLLALFQPLSPFC